MRVVIAGGHGQIALLLEKALAERGDTPVGIVRNPDHVERRRGRPAPRRSSWTWSRPTSARWPRS